MSDVQRGINALKGLGALGSTGPTPEEQLLGLGALGPDTGPDYIDKIEGPGDAFTAGIQSGILNLKANTQNFKASVNTLIGRDRKAQSQLQEAELLAQDASIPLSGMEQFDAFLEQPTFNGFINQVAAATGQFVPSLVVSMAAAAATGGVATTATALRTTGAKLASGKNPPFLKNVPVTTETLRQQKDAKQLRSLLERSYKNAVATKQGKNAPFKITPNEKLLLEGTLYPALKREALQRSGIRGALVGAAGQEFVQGSGIAFGDYAEQGMTSISDVLKSYAQGSVFAGIGVGSEALVAGSIINTLKKGTSKFKPTLTADGIEDLFRTAPTTDTSFLKDLFRVQTTTAFSEGIAEALQEELSIQQKFSIDDAYTQANAKLDRVHALFAGFFGGVGVGTGLGTAPAVLNKSRQLLNRGSYKEYLQQRYDTRAQELQGPRGQIFKQRAKNIKEEFDALFNPTMKVNSQYTDIDSQEEFNKALPEIEKAHPGKMENVFAIPRPGLGVFFTTNEQIAEVANNLFTTRPYDYDFHEQFLATNLGFTRVKDPGDDAVVGAINKKTNEFIKFQTTSTGIEENNKTGVEIAEERMKNILGKNYDRKNFDVIVQNIDQHLEYRRKGIVVDTTQLDEQGEPVRVAFEDVYDTDDFQQQGLTEEEQIVDQARVNEERRVEAERQVTQQKLDLVRGINTRDLNKTQTNALNAYFEEVFPAFAQGGLTFKNLLDMADYQARIAERIAELKTGAKRTGIQSFKELSDVLGELKKEDTKKAYKEALTTSEKANYTRIHNRIKAAAASPVGTQDMDISPLGRNLAAAEANPGLWASSLVEQIIQVLSPEQELPTGRASSVDTAVESIQALNSSQAIPVAVTEIIKRTTLPAEFETPETEVVRQETQIDPETQEEKKKPVMGLKPVREQYETTEEYETAYERWILSKHEARLNMVDSEVVGRRGGSGTIDNPYKQYIAAENRQEGQEGKRPPIWKNYSIDEDTPKADRRRSQGQINQSYVHVLFRPEIEAARDNFSQQLVDDFAKKAKALNDRTEGGNFLRIVPADYLSEFRNQSRTTSEFVEIPLDVMRNAKEFVFVKHQIANSNELVRRNVNEFRDIYEDVRTRIRQAKDRAGSNMGASADAIYKFSVFETREFGSAEAAVDMGVLLEGLSTIFKVTRKREAEELELTGKRYGKNISFRRATAFNDFLNFAADNGIYIGYSPQGYKAEGPGSKIDVVGSPVSQVEAPASTIPQDITPQQTIKFYYDLLMNPNTLTTKGKLTPADLKNFEKLLKDGGVSNRQIDAIKYGIKERIVESANREISKLNAFAPNINGEVFLDTAGRDFIKSIEPGADQDAPSLVAGLNGLFVEVNPDKVEKGTKTYDGTKVLDYANLDVKGTREKFENIEKAQQTFTLLNEYKIVPDVEQVVEEPDLDRTQYNIFMGPKYVGRGFYQAFINDLKKEGKSKSEINNISSQIRRVHVADLQAEYPQLGIKGIEKNGSTLSLTAKGKGLLKKLEPTATRLMVGNHGVYIEMNKPANVGKFVKKRLQYNEYKRDGVKLYDQFKTVNYANYKTDKWYADPKEYAELKTEPVQLEMDFDGPTINIFAGTKENAHLSNFAPRPFVGPNGRDYISVEHGYQSNKTGKFNKKVSDEFVRLGRTPLKSWLVKNAGKPKIKDDANLKLMKRLIKASFEQNPAELQKLIATGDTTLTHIGGDKYFEKRFPQILMEVRSELGAPGNQLQLDLQAQAPVVPIEPKEEESTAYYLLENKIEGLNAKDIRPELRARNIIRDMKVQDLIASDLNSGVYDIRSETLSLRTVLKSLVTPFDPLASLEYMIENGVPEPRSYQSFKKIKEPGSESAKDFITKFGKTIYYVSMDGTVNINQPTEIEGLQEDFFGEYSIPTLNFNVATYKDLETYIDKIISDFLVTEGTDPKPLLIEASSNTPLSNLQEASSNIILNPTTIPFLDLYTALGSADLSKRPKNTKFPEHKVIVAGSRTFSESEVFNKTLDKLFGKNKNVTIVSGMAKGADTLAVEYAKNKNLNLAKFPVRKKEHPMDRNTRMAVESTSAVIFFDNIGKPSPGSLDMLKKSVERFGPSNVFVFDKKGKKVLTVGDATAKALPQAVSETGKRLFEPKKADYAFRSGAKKGQLSKAKEKQFEEAKQEYLKGLARASHHVVKARAGLAHLAPLMLLKELAEDVSMRQQDPNSVTMTAPINEWIGDALVLESAKRHNEPYLGGGGAISTGMYQNELDNLVIAPEQGIFPAEGFDKGAFRERQDQTNIEQSMGTLYKPMKSVKENKVSSPISETPQGEKYKKKTGKVNSRPFRRQILDGITSAARRAGLFTNLKVIHDNEIQSWMRQPGFNLEGFESIRKDFLDNPNKIGMNVKYKDFDVIVLKNDVSEAEYYLAYMHELGEAFVGQELEKSLKVKATRDKLMKEFEKARDSKDAPKKYLDEETGFNEFIADQFAVAIRKKLNMDVNQTADQQFEGMSIPIKSWFKRLVKQLETFFKAAMKAAGKGRFEMNATVQEYIDQIATNLNEPSSRTIPYQTKAKIERQIEDLLGPETFTEKSLNGVIKQMNKLMSAENMPKWVRQVFYAADNRLRALGKNIPRLKDGRTVGEALADFYYSQSRTLTKSGLLMVKSAKAQAYVNEIAKALDAKDSWLYATLNSAQQAILLEAESDRPTENISERAQRVRAVFKKAYDELGLKDLGVEFRQDFFPRLIAIYDIAGDDGIRANLINLLMQKNPKVPRVEIEDAVTELVKKGSNEIEFEAATNDPLDVGILRKYKRLFENVRTEELRNIKAAEPPEVALKKYFDKAVTRSEFEKRGGVKYLRELMDKLSPEEQTEAQVIQDAIMGRISPIESGFLRIANNFGLVINVITLLGFAVLASLPDLAGPVLRSRSADTSQLFSVIKNLAKNREEMIELAKEIGVIGVDAVSTFFINAGEVDFMNEKAKQVSNSFFRLTGLEAFTKFSRVFATGMGKQFMIKHAEKAKRGDTTSETYLAELQVTADEVLAWSEGKASPAVKEKVNQGLVRFVDESIVRPNSAERPVWASDPRYALIWQLKSFYYAYGKTIMGGTFRDSMNNAKTQGAGAAVMPLLFVAMMLLPITMLGWEIREFTKAGLAWLLPGISPDDAGVDYYRTNSMTNGQYWTELIDRTGMLGPVSMALPVFLEDHRHGKPFWLSPLGPTAERVYDGVTWDWKVADYIPGYSQLDTRALARN